MDASFFPGCRVLIFGHGECLNWFNFCQARAIANLGFPPHVNVRVLARPNATLPFLSTKAADIARFCPNVWVVNLGMFDLLDATTDPISLADRFWHILGFMTDCMYAGFTDYQSLGCGTASSTGSSFAGSLILGSGGCVS